MLDKKTLDKFTKKANQGRNQFCIRKYAFNNFIKHQEEFNSEAKDWWYTDDEAIKNSCRYKNFWGIVIPSLQHWWTLSVARLIDPPYFRWDKNKVNLSIYYIIELLEDEDLKLNIKKGLNQQQRFIKWIKKLRDTFLAHNDMEEKENIIPAGIENFFESLNSVIWKIKEKHPDLKECNDLNLEYTEKLSEAGVKEMFEKII